MFTLQNDVCILANLFLVSFLHFSAKSKISLKSKGQALITNLNVTALMH